MRCRGRQDSTGIVGNSVYGNVQRSVPLLHLKCFLIGKLYYSHVPLTVVRCNFVAL